MSVSRNFNMLSEITTGKEVKKLDYSSIDKVNNMDTDVASDDVFVKDGGCVCERNNEEGEERLRIR